MDCAAGSTAEVIRYPWADAPEEGMLREVAPGIFWLRLPLPMALDHVNLYVLDDGDGWTVVDAGLVTRRARAIWESLLAGPLAGKPLRRVVVTHYHPDHVGLAGWLQAMGAELVTTRTSWLTARMLILDVQPVPVAETLAFWRAAGMDPALYAKRSQERPFNFADVVAPLPLGYTRIADGDTIRMGGRDWLVRTGDGHAPEHATFWQVDGPLILGGDQLLPSISANLGVYASEPLADPVAEWIDHFTIDQSHIALPPIVDCPVENVSDRVPTLPCARCHRHQPGSWAPRYRDLNRFALFNRPHPRGRVLTQLSQPDSQHLRNLAQVLHPGRLPQDTRFVKPTYG